MQLREILKNPIYEEMCNILHDRKTLVIAGEG